MSLITTKIWSNKDKQPLDEDEQPLDEDEQPLDEDEPTTSPILIFRQITIETSTEEIPEQLFERPPLNEKRIHGQVPAHQLNPGSFFRFLVDKCPSARISKASFEYCNVSITVSCLDILLDFDFPIEFRGWEIFHCHLEEASPDIRHRFFEHCASLAPSLKDRTDKSWTEHFQKICAADNRWKVKHRRPLGMLHMLFQSAGGKGIPIVTESFDDYASKSVNDNLADLRMLFSDNCADRKAFNELDIEDRITRYVPIGFPRVVYNTLPPSLINALPFKTVMGAHCTISKTYQTVTRIKKAENDISLLLCYCATLQKVDDHLRKWVKSSEGRHEYYRVVHRLNQKVSPEELAISLAALCFFERLEEVQEDTGHEQESCITSLSSRMSNLHVTKEPRFEYSYVTEFIDHITGSKPKIRPNLWRIVGASFRKACFIKRPSNDWRCMLTVLGWLEISIDIELRTDDLVEIYWDSVLVTSENLAIDSPRTAIRR